MVEFKVESWIWNQIFRATLSRSSAVGQNLGLKRWWQPFLFQLMCVILIQMFVKFMWFWCLISVDLCDFDFSFQLYLWYFDFSFRLYLWYFDFSPSPWPVSIRQLSQLHRNFVTAPVAHKCNMVEIKITQMQYGWYQDKKFI